MVFEVKLLILLERRGFESPFSHHLITAIARLGKHGSPFVCIFVCIQPYNFLDMAAPVSRVSTPEGCA